LTRRARGLEIGSRAQVDGPIRFEGENEAIVSSGAKLASPVQFKKHVHKKEEFGRTSAFWTCVLLIAFAAYGMVLFLAVPSFAQESVHSAENIGASLGLGLLVFFGVLNRFDYRDVHFGRIVCWFLFIVCVVDCGCMRHQPVVGALIGQWILGRSKETWPLIGRMMAGCILYPYRDAAAAYRLAHKTGSRAVGTWCDFARAVPEVPPPAPVQAPYVPTSAPLTPLTPAGGAGGGLRT